MDNIVEYDNYEINNFMKITGIKNNVFDPIQTLAKNQMRLCNALSTLLHSCKNWTTKTKDKSRLTAAEMKYEKNSRLHLV